MDSAEFTSWMGFYQIEPFGDLVADERHGSATSLLANLNRDPKTRPEPYMPADFIHWRATDQVVDEEEPTLLEDPVAQSNLIRAAMFGLPPR